MFYIPLCINPSLKMVIRFLYSVLLQMSAKTSFDKTASVALGGTHIKLSWWYQYLHYPQVVRSLSNGNITNTEIIYVSIKLVGGVLGHQIYWLHFLICVIFSTKSNGLNWWYFGFIQFKPLSWLNHMGKKISHCYSI